MLVVGQVLAETYSSTPGFNFSDGRKLAELFLSRTFTNKVYDVTISDTGEIIVNLTLRAAVLGCDQHEVVKVWDGLRHRYVDVQPINWPGGKGPPSNVPVCGYLGNSAVCAPGFPYAAIIGGVAGGLMLLALCLIVSLLTVRNRAAMALLYDKSWIVTDVHLERVDLSQQAALQAQFNKHPPAETADHGFQRWYNGFPIWTKPLLKYSITTKASHMITHEFSHDLQIIMREVMRCSHPNINRFFGLYLSSIRDRCFVNAVAALCSRGSICDLFEIREVDWDFRTSFITNFFAGLAYIHLGPLKFHGGLSSSKCLLDRYFTLKLADYGYFQIATNIGLRTKTHHWEENRHLPPAASASGNFSKEADVFSVGLILTEITTARLFKAEEICPVPTHPTLALVNKALLQAHEIRDVPRTVQNVSAKLTDIIHRCLEPDPCRRPDICSLQNEASVILGTDRNKATVVEKTIGRLQIYAERLEDDVAARTVQLLAERQRSDKLLQELLPAVIVEQLRRGGTAAAEIFDSVTVFFSDFPGFATFVQEKSAMETVHIVSSVFKVLDNALVKFAVYKVETIGDSYMVVSGLPVKHGRHAEEIVSMGCLMLRTYYSSMYTRFRLGLRGGAHSGICAAGIVGLNRPRYCLFGDTVNMASRMCATGESGRLHVSSQTAALVSKEIPDAEIVARGTISVKGKGDVKTYWILDKCSSGGPRTCVIEPIRSECSSQPKILGTVSHRSL